MLCCCSDLLCSCFGCLCCIFFFFKQKTAYEMRISDWSSDVCSSDLLKIVDEQHYHELATHLARGDGFAMNTGPTSMRPPLYPFFVAATWALDRKSVV